MPDEIKTLAYADPLYPPLLREIPQPPQTLYYRGALKEGEKNCLAVVGTRKPTFYGEQVTPALVEELALAGLTIVSGLATGIDALAHKAALKAGGRTIAVLGSGIDDSSFFPQDNLRLMHEIIAGGGLVISEFPPGTPARREHFPQRNRIISGLSRAVLVIEAPTRSGSLITSRHALDQNRDVFAIPGPITSPYSWGPNHLIKQGARPVLKAQDILDELGIEALPIKTGAQTETKAGTVPAREPSDPLTAFLSAHPVHIDELIRKSGQRVAAVSARLTALEIQGKVKNVGGGRYVKT